MQKALDALRRHPGFAAGQRLTAQDPGRIFLASKRCEHWVILERRRMVLRTLVGDLSWPISAQLRNCHVAVVRRPHHNIRDENPCFGSHLISMGKHRCCNISSTVRTFICSAEKLRICFGRRRRSCRVWPGLSAHRYGVSGFNYDHRGHAGLRSLL